MPHHISAHTAAAGGTGHVTLSGSLTAGPSKPTAVTPLLVPHRKERAFDVTFDHDSRVAIVDYVDVVVPGSTPHTTGLILSVRHADAAEQLIVALERAAELLRERMSPAEADEHPEHAGGGVPRLPAEPWPTVRVPMPVDGPRPDEQPDDDGPSAEQELAWDQAEDARRHPSDT